MSHAGDEMSEFPKENLSDENGPVSPVTETGEAFNNSDRIISCTNDMEEDIYEKSMFISSEQFTEGSLSISEFSVSKLSSNTSLELDKSDKEETAGETIGDFLSQQIQHQDHLLNKLSTACQGFFDSDSKHFKKKLSERKKQVKETEFNCTVSSCSPKVKSNDGYFVETTFFAPKEERAVSPSRERKPRKSVIKHTNYSEVLPGIAECNLHSSDSLKLENTTSVELEEEGTELAADAIDKVLSAEVKESSGTNSKTLDVKLEEKPDENVSQSTSGYTRHCEVGESDLGETCAEIDDVATTSEGDPLKPSDLMGCLRLATGASESSAEDSATRKKRIQAVTQHYGEYAKKLHERFNTAKLRNIELENVVKGIFEKTIKFDKKSDKKTSANKKRKEISVIYLNTLANERSENQCSEQDEIAVRNAHIELSSSFGGFASQDKATSEMKDIQAFSDFGFDGKYRKHLRHLDSQNRVDLAYREPPESLDNLVMKRPKEFGDQGYGSQLMEDQWQKSDECLPKTEYPLVTALPSSECSLVKFVRDAHSMFSTPSDSKLLIPDLCLVRTDGPKPRNAEAELCFSNPFQAVFRRVALTDVNQLYEFMDFQKDEDDIEELAKPLTKNFIPELLKKIKATDSRLRKTHQEVMKQKKERLLSMLEPYFSSAKRKGKRFDAASSEESEGTTTSVDDD